MDKHAVVKEETSSSSVNTLLPSSSSSMRVLSSMLDLIRVVVNGQQRLQAGREREERRREKEERRGWNWGRKENQFEWRKNRRHKEEEEHRAKEESRKRKEEEERQKKNRNQSKQTKEAEEPKEEVSSLTNTLLYTTSLIAAASAVYSYSQAQSIQSNVDQQQALLHGSEETGFNGDDTLVSAHTTGALMEEHSQTILLRLQQDHQVPLQECLLSTPKDIQDMAASISLTLSSISRVDMQEQVYSQGVAASSALTLLLALFLRLLPSKPSLSVSVVSLMSPMTLYWVYSKVQQAQAGSAKRKALDQCRKYLRVVELMGKKEEARRKAVGRYAGDVLEERKKKRREVDQTNEETKREEEFEEVIVEQLKGYKRGMVMN